MIRGITVGLAAACLFEMCGCTGAMSVPAKSDLIGAWTVESIGARPVIDNSPAYLEFAEDDRLSGNASCNRLTGRYTLSGSRLTFGQAAATRMMCPPALMKQEKRFLASLEKVAEVRFKNGLLSLLDSGANLVSTASRRAGE